MTVVVVVVVAGEGRVGTLSLEIRGLSVLAVVYRVVAVGAGVGAVDVVGAIVVGSVVGAVVVVVGVIVRTAVGAVAVAVAGVLLMPLLLLLSVQVGRHSVVPEENWRRSGVERWG